MLLGLAVVTSACIRSPAVRKQRAVERAEEYLKRGQPNEAIIELRNALEIDKDFLIARHTLGRAYATKGWFADAAADLERARALQPDSVPIAVDLGRSLIELGAWDKVDDVAEWLLGRDPKHPDGLFMRSTVLLAQGKVEEAKRLLATEATSPLLELARADTLLRSSQMELAERTLRTALDTYPNHPKLLVGLGRVYLVREQNAKAAALFGQAKAAQPVEWEARLGLAAARARMGQTAEVIEELEGIDLEARPPNIQMTLARLYLMDGRPGEAVSSVAPVVKELGG